MMTGPSRPRRRRGRRGGQRAQQPDQVQQSAEEAVAPERRPEREQPRDAAEPRPVREARDRAASDDQQGAREGGGRKRARSRRRNTRRPTIGPMPTEVLKDSVRPAPAAEPLATRTLDEFTTPTGMTFGCPMLTRTRIGMPFDGGHHVPRCAMGWALHGESEALFCMRTPDMLDCWKAHPEKEAELRGADEAENAAD